jgi:hypothetical protein
LLNFSWFECHFLIRHNAQIAFLESIRISSLKLESYWFLGPINQRNSPGDILSN